MSHNTLAPQSRNSFTDEALRFARNPIGYMIPDQYEQQAAEITADILPGTGHQRGYNRMVEAMSRETDRPIRNILNKAEGALEGAGLVADFIPGLKAAGVAAGSILPWMMRGQKNLNAGKFGQAGIVGYHGSPHKFDKFDHSQMSSGEGAQAYGWGTYIAEDPAVAGTYKGMGRAHDYDPSDGYSAIEDQLSQRMMKLQDAQKYDEDAALEELLINRDTDRARARFADSPKALQEIDRYEGQFIPSNLYEVDLPDEKIAQMLDWDKTLREQPEILDKLLSPRDKKAFAISQAQQEILKDPKGSLRAAEFDALQSDWTKLMGHDMPEVNWNWSGEQLVINHGGEGLTKPKDFSLFMKDKGIPGIKYFDGNSRAGGQGTRNFIPFDANDTTILSRNGEKVNALDNFAETTRKKHGLDSFDLYEKGDMIDLSMISTPKGNRKMGAGSAAMEDLIKYADNKGQSIKLSVGMPGDGFGTTSRNRLVKFYKRFGFVENKGRNKDFRISPGMYRRPQ